MLFSHDDVIKWKHFPRNWPFVREIHRSPVNFPHNGQWRGALMFSLIYAWINDWVNNREAGDLRRQHGHYDVIVMRISFCTDFTMYPYSSVLSYRHRGNHMIVPVPARPQEKPWVNKYEYWRIPLWPGLQNCQINPIVQEWDKGVFWLTVPSNEDQGVSNHWQADDLFKSLLMLRAARKHESLV